MEMMRKIRTEKISKKISISIIEIFLLVFLIAACSQKNPNDSIGQGTTINQENPTGSGEVKEFRMTAKQFAFEPSTIGVNKGDKVRLIVTSLDVPHGISIPEYGINERLEPGKPVTVEFTASKSGTFTAFCSVFCGSGHQGMKGKIIVK